VYTARLGRERDRARAEARNAEQVATFLSEIFSVADPAESFGTDLTARELLERSARRVDRELAGQPRAQATLLGAIGGVYRGLGRYADATPYLERALELRRGRDGGTALDLAGAEYALAGLLAGTGAVQRAESLYRASLARRERELDADHPDRIRSLVGLGSLRASIGDEAGASEILGRAVSEARRGGDDDWEVLAEALAASADVGFSRGEFAASEQLYREVLQLRVARSGTDHPRTLRATVDLARVVAAEGDIRGADSLLSGAISLGKRVLGPEHPDIATWIGERATMRLEQGDYRLGDSLTEEMIALLRARLGPKHPQVGNAVRQLATTRYEEALYPAAERGIVEALSIHRSQFPEDHPDVRMDLNGLALINIDAGQADSGLRIVRRLQALVRRQLGNEHPEVLVYLNNEGTALRNLGRLAESDSVLRAGALLAEKLFADEAALGRVLLNLNVAVNSVLADRYEEAERLARPVLDVVKRELGERNRYIAYVLFVAGRADVELGRPTQGEQELRQAVAILESFAPTFWGLGLGRAGIAASLAAQARWDAAAAELERARQLMAAYPPPGDIYVDNANRSLRRVYERAGRQAPFELRGR